MNSTPAPTREEILAAQKRKYDEQCYAQQQDALPAWARDDWKPLAPGQIQVDDTITVEDEAADRALRTHNRMMALCEALEGSGRWIDWKGHRR